MGFAENLKHYRQQKEISQRRLAADIEVSPSLIAFYERGQRKPSFDNLCALSHYFGVPITALVEDDSILLPSLSPDEMSEQDRKIYDELMSLSDLVDAHRRGLKEGITPSEGSAELHSTTETAAYNLLHTLSGLPDEARLEPEGISEVMEQVIKYFRFLLSTNDR